MRDGDIWFSQSFMTASDPRGVGASQAANAKTVKTTSVDAAYNQTTFY